MNGNCVMVPAAYFELQRKYPQDTPCKHCIYSQYGCPNVETFILGSRKYVAIEQSLNELPICGIWCKNCKDTSGKIYHKTFWHGKAAFAVRCNNCGESFLLYESKVRREYTGFKNGFGNFVPPVPYGTRQRQLLPTNAKYLEMLDSAKNTVVYSSSDETPTAMEIALKKAGLL